MKNMETISCATFKITQSHTWAFKTHFPLSECKHQNTNYLSSRKNKMVQRKTMRKREREKLSAHFKCRLALRESKQTEEREAFIGHLRQRPSVQTGRSFLIRARLIKCSQPRPRTSVWRRPRHRAAVTRHSAVRRCNQAEADVRILSDGLSCLPPGYTLTALWWVCVCYWGPLGGEWSHISFNYSLQGCDVMFLICFLLLPSPTLSRVLAASSFIFVPFSFPSKYSCLCFFLFCFFLVFFSYCQGVVIYVAITPTVSPVRLIPKNIKLFSLSAIGSIDVAWVSFPFVSETDSEILLTFSSRIHLLPAAFSFLCSFFCFWSISSLPVQSSISILLVKKGV